LLISSCLVTEGLRFLISVLDGKSAAILLLALVLLFGFVNIGFLVVGVGVFSLCACIEV
jgi:hypothetical protein